MSDELNSHFAEGNNFYIHGPIDSDVIEQVIKPFRAKIDELADKVSKKTIKFYINSNGGEASIMFTILGMFDECKSKGITVETYVEGFAFSAAAVIAVCGHKRYVHKFSSLMFHSMRSGYTTHNPEMMKREAAWYTWIDSQMCDIVEQHTKLKDLKEKMMPDLYYIKGSKLLLSTGCADSVI